MNSVIICTQHGIVNLRIFNSCVKIRNYTAFSLRIDSAVCKDA